MEELTIRLNNLRRLVAVAKKAKAPQKLVAKRLAVDSSRFSQLCGPNPIRKILEPTARAFEKQLRRPKRWLDTERTEEELLSAWLSINELNETQTYALQEISSSDTPDEYGLNISEPSPQNYFNKIRASPRLEKLISDARFLDLHNVISEQNYALLESVIALIKDSNKEKLQASLIRNAEATAVTPPSEDRTSTKNSLVDKVLSIDPTSLLSTQEATSKQKT